MRFQIVKTVDLCSTLKRTLAVLIGAMTLSSSPLWAARSSWEVVTTSGNQMRCALGMPEEKIALMACAAACEPIPWQLDERNGDGDWAFTDGALARADDPSGVLDDNDEIVFMAADAGRRAEPNELAASCRLALRLSRPNEAERWVYLVGVQVPAARATRSYVQFDAETDTLVGDHISLGFRDRLPQVLTLETTDGVIENVLDRIKIRASAWLLGIIPVQRDEGDLESADVGWRAGPIRIVRRQRQRIRVGWGIKSPRFAIDTYFSRNSASIPVAFRLNFPPTYFFADIIVDAVLDFRDLREWRVATDSTSASAAIGSLSPAMMRTLNNEPAGWFALIGPRVQIVQFLDVSSSLRPLDKRLALRVTDVATPPEAVPGEQPSIGYRLRGWKGVDSGAHAFAVTTYVLPSNQDLQTFVREHAIKTKVEVVSESEGDAESPRREPRIRQDVE